MDNIFDMLGKLGSQKSQNESSQAVPKEILDQYPYGQFPLRYTKSGQEILRKQIGTFGLSFERLIGYAKYYNNNNVYAGLSELARGVN